ncbi:MAG: winged helix-turn-helix transcriptional regulator [Chloroflexota bacterium]|nr:MAG: winged helix-turn-helix transcriptional regulator [Chloroflexota bacterium]
MTSETLISIEKLLPSPPATDVFTMLDRVARQLREIKRQTVNQVELTPPQYQTLRLLWERDSQPFKDLAAANGCTRPTMTGIVDTLEKNGLVTREPNPDDRRSLLVTLSEKGKALEDSAPDLDRIYATCCVGLTSEEFQQLGTLLEKLDRSLDCTC